MKRKITKTVTCLSMSAILLFSGVFVGVPSTAGASKNKRIVMNKKSLNMKAGEKFKLKVKKIKPANLGKAVKYRSEKKNIATVDQKGVVKAANKGKTNIIVTSKKDKSVKVTVAVKVVNTNTPDVPVPSDTPIPSDTPVPTASPKPMETPAPPINTNTPAADDGRVFGSISEIYADIISEQFRLMMPQKDGDIIALDLKDSSLSDTDRQAFADILTSKYGETVIKTKEELLEEGKIKEDNTYGFVFEGGVLITVKDNKTKQDDFTFDIRCTKTGTSGVFFDGCRAFAKDGVWKYELGRKGLS